MTMCGIFFACQSDQCHCDISALKESLREAIIRRGPDKQSEHILNIGSFQSTFIGAVLWLRGEVPKPQPLIQNENVLLWNGDLFNVDFDRRLSDTQYLFDKLNRSVTEENVSRVLSTCQGPGAYVYYNATFRKVWFGRDYFGKYIGLCSFTKHTKDI